MAKKTDEFDLSNFDVSADSFSVEEDQNYDPAPGDMPPPRQPAAYSEANPVVPDLDSPGSPHPTVDRKVVNLTADIPVQVVAVLGKRNVTVKEIVGMKMGQVLELNRLPNEAIDLVANGKLIAKGELVEIDGRLGVRVLKIFD